MQVRSRLFHAVVVSGLALGSRAAAASAAAATIATVSIAASTIPVGCSAGDPLDLPPMVVDENNRVREADDAGAEVVADAEVMDANMDANEHDGDAGWPPTK